MPVYTGGGAPRPVPIRTCPGCSDVVRATPVRIVVTSHDNDRRAIGQEHRSRSTGRGAPVKDRRVAVHHRSTFTLRPLPLGPILVPAVHPLQPCSLFLILVPAVATVPIAAFAAKATATDTARHGLNGQNHRGPRLWQEAIGSERRATVVRITVELVEVTRQGRREGTRCRSNQYPGKFCTTSSSEE